MADRANNRNPERQALLEHLVAHRVEGILIGGVAIQNYRPTYNTDDIDFAPKGDIENLRRLSAALNELDCRLIVDPSDPSSQVALPPDYFTPASLANARFWNLATRLGDLDICLEPAGFPGGYDDLRPRATLQTVTGTTIVLPVARHRALQTTRRPPARPRGRPTRRVWRVYGVDLDRRVRAVPRRQKPRTRRPLLEERRSPQRPRGSRVEAVVSLGRLQRRTGRSGPR